MVEPGAAAEAEMWLRPQEGKEGIAVCCWHFDHLNLAVIAIRYFGHLRSANSVAPRNMNYTCGSANNPAPPSRAAGCRSVGCSEEMDGGVRIIASVCVADNGALRAPTAIKCREASGSREVRQRAAGAPWASPLCLLGQTPACRTEV
ncbi:hypothetical protein EYF80_021410 [Liparis tanakae]|uniref:Uncharacterized protein n=1 Tax=Liparis tanakae TaxID=230148 RepID=A0A4Z2HRN9_9TELE|nr:hypothetical protein EYF80_021410 [Liparis tanakae]